MIRLFISIAFLLLLTSLGIISSCKNYNKKIKVADAISMQKTDSAFCSSELIYYEISNGIEYSEKDFKKFDRQEARYPIGHPDTRTLSFPFPKNNKNIIILQKIVEEIKNNYVVHNNKNKSLYKLYSNYKKSKKSPIKDLSIKTIELFMTSDMHYDHYWNQIGFMNCFGSISFCKKNIVQYTFLFNEVSPSELGKNEEKNYSIYLAFDTTKDSIIKKDNFIDASKINELNLMLIQFAAVRKKEIIVNYRENYPENYLNVFKQPDYDYGKINIKIDADCFSHFTSEGIVFNINVKDENFLLDNKRSRIENYTSSLTIPYKEFKNYFNKKSSLYASLD